MLQRKVILRAQHGNIPTYGELPKTALRWMTSKIFLDGSVVITFTYSLWCLCSEVTSAQLEPARNETSAVLLWKPTELTLRKSSFRYSAWTTATPEGKQVRQQCQSVAALCFWSCKEAAGPHQNGATLQPSAQMHSVWAPAPLLPQQETLNRDPLTIRNHHLFWQDKLPSPRTLTNDICNCNLEVKVWICSSRKKISPTILFI